MNVHGAVSMPRAFRRLDARPSEPWVEAFASFERSSQVADDPSPGLVQGIASNRSKQSPAPASLDEVAKPWPSTRTHEYPEVRDG